MDEGAATAAGGITEEEEEGTNRSMILEQVTTATMAIGIETTTKDRDIPVTMGIKRHFLRLGAEMGLRTADCRIKTCVFGLILVSCVDLIERWRWLLVGWKGERSSTFLLYSSTLPFCTICHEHHWIAPCSEIDLRRLDLRVLDSHSA